jgi:hypothetical protein
MKFFAANKYFHCNLINQHWVQNHRRHRLNGPAITWASGARAWYCGGDYHRKDGPAIIYSIGVRRWYIHGKRIEQEYGEIV